MVLNTASEEELTYKRRVELLLLGEQSSGRTYTVDSLRGYIQPTILTIEQPLQQTFGR